MYVQEADDICFWHAYEETNDSVIQNELDNDCMIDVNHTEYSETNHNNEIADSHDNEKNYVQGTIPLSYNGYVQTRL